VQRLRNAIARFWASRRARTGMAIATVAAGFACFLAGIVYGFIRVNVYETPGFADNAVQAFRDDAVKQLIGERLTQQMIIRLPSTLQASEPVLNVLVLEAVQTPQFARIFRSAAIDANRVFFGKNTDDPELDLSDAGPLIQAVVETVDPQLADALPATIEGLLIEVSTKPQVDQLVRIAEDAREFTFLWPSLAIALFAIAILVAPNRRRCVVAVGVLMAVAGLVLLIGAQAIRAFVLSGRTGSTEADAARATADAYLDDAPIWGFVIAVAGGVLAAAAISAGHPGEVGRRVRRVWEAISSRPTSPWLQILRGLVAGAIAVFVLFQRDLAVTIAVVAAGFVLLLYALTEVMRAAERVGGRAAALLPWLVAFAAVIAIVVTGILVLTP
jgi:hypothetical protein